MIDFDMVKAIRVHPGIGIARVGNARGDGEWFFAAEVPGAPPMPDDGSFRDQQGRIRRQAVRFRVYAELTDGTMKEITADDGVAIEWRVEVANLKAGWYRFENAMDLPEPYAKIPARRNASIQGAARARLDITPGLRSISGRDADPTSFDSGQFSGKPVYLGEIRTDSVGRLVFLGGHGTSAPLNPDERATTFANNDGWHDDVSDGPVHATVRFPSGLAVEAQPGYVVVCPPNYAPGLFGAVTLLDVIDDLFAAGQPSGRCSFSAHIWPLFQRITDLQWTNHGLYVLSGLGSPLDAHDEKVIARLRDHGPANAAFRSAVFSLFRSPASTTAREAALLAHYGDYYDDYAEVPGTRLCVTALMFKRLQQWQAGEFDDDWRGEPLLPRFASLSSREQAEALDKVGLFECLGGPFHPGIELTWCMRLQSMWKEPYRLAVLAGTARQDYGPTLTREAALASGGPHDGAAAGSLTRWLGIPWQTDEASCLSDFEYEPSTYLSFPSFWGARVPNRVLSVQAWERVTAGDISTAQAMKHFSWREDWLRDLKGDYLGKINRMIGHWWELGILERREPTEEAKARGVATPAWIESGRPDEVTGSNTKVDLAAAIESLDAVDATAAGAAIGALRSHVPPRRHLRRDEI